MSPDFCCPLCGFGAGVRLRHDGVEDRVRCLNCGGVTPARAVLAPGTSDFDSPSERELHSMVMGTETRAAITRSRAM